MAIIRPEMVEKVEKDLNSNSFPAFTRFDVYGKGKGAGVKVWGLGYDAPKTTLMIVVEDSIVGRAVDIINNAARTGKTGDGRIFVLNVEEAYTVRTGEKGL